MRFDSDVPAVSAVVDADGHVVEPLSAWDAAPPEHRPRIERDAHGYEHVIVGDAEILAVPLGTLATPGARFGDPTSFRCLEEALPGGFDPKVRLVDMDSEGIDQAMLYPSVGLYAWALEEPAPAVALARTYNDWLAEYCSADPARLFGAAMIPVQDPLAAVGELRRAHDELGFPAVFVRPNPCCGRTLSHRAYEPLWSAAEELDMAIGVHEGSSVIVPTLGSDRPFNPLVLHAVSHSFEEMLAFAELVSFGVLERHPDLQLLFLESSGGWVPFWLERLDEQAESFGDFCPEMKLRPSEYFARQCFVSYEIDETSLPLLAPVIGEERIVWGSDYPHHDATFPGAVLRLRRTIASMAQPARGLVLGDNARRAYGLPDIPARPTSYANAYFGAIATRDDQALLSLFASDADLLIAGATIRGVRDIVRYHQRGVFSFADLLPRPGPAVPCTDGVRVDGELRLEGRWHRIVHTFEIRAGRIRRLTAEGELPSPASLGIP